MNTNQTEYLINNYSKQTWSHAEWASYFGVPESIINFKVQCLHLQKPIIYKTAIRKRGWTEYAIAKYLGVPDKIIPNPHNPDNEKSYLYFLDRVEKLEKSVNIKERKPRNINQTHFV